MTKKYKSPVLSVLSTSFFMCFIILTLYYLVTDIFQINADWITIIALMILCFTFFMLINSITITVNANEINFYRITGKYKSIPMNAYSIGTFIVKRRLNGLSGSSVYNITYKLDMNDNLENKLECKCFNKKVFESLIAEIYALRSETNSSSTPAFIQSDSPTEPNLNSKENTQVYKIEKERCLEEQSKIIKILGFAFLVLLILTIICAIFVYLNRELAFNQLENYINALLIIAGITMGIFFGFIGLFIRKRQFINIIPTEILMNATILRIDESQFNLSNITNMKITPASYTTTPIRTMNFTYEGKKYKYQLDGFNRKTIFPEYNQFTKQLNCYFIDKKQFIFDL